ncbi:MAG: DUF433 domain-containing protein, partial [Candidatus Rokubacteria bacterium]|nr:DUF433 domain-containing protein [Candidatus Rokubacteria bacterium]
ATFEEVLAGYPDLEREDIQQALAYVEENQDRVRPLPVGQDET